MVKYKYKVISMKLKYRNITIPYFHYDKKRNCSYYIYQNQEYTDLNLLFSAFLGSYLTYHFAIKDSLKEVHNLSEVLEALLKNKDSFSIPNKYKDEYSTNEYDYIKGLKKALVNDELKLLTCPNYDSSTLSKGTKDSKLAAFYNEIHDKYQKVIIPKKITSSVYESDYYVVGGEAYESIYHALDAVYDNSLYYQFGGTKSQNNRTHQHSHSFDDLIALIFSNSQKFKIHTTQREFYSQQELAFLNKLSDKLKSMNFHSVSRKYEAIDWEEYCYLKDNKKYFSLLISNIKDYFKEQKYNREKLRSHKI